MSRKALAGALAVAAMLATACAGGGGSSSGAEATSPTDPGKVSGSIKVLTNRTDLAQDGSMKKYAADFNKIYPKVKVTFEGITDYEGEVKIRMNTKNYGDVLLIPNVITRDNFPKFFASLGSTSELSKKYRFMDKSEVAGKSYGIATFSNANGFVYNKAVWQKAGITEWPTTPEEFINDLTAIKDKTDSTPYYTNFKDGWPLTSWTNLIGSVSCDPKANDNLATSTEPWAEGSDLNVIDTLLYNIVHSSLAENDPTTTNWEQSKNLLAKGKIATMQLGSWAVSQMQAAATAAGEKSEDIGFMPFPAQVNGKFCDVLAPDYLQAVSIHSKHKEAARAWIDWFTDKSGYAQTEKAISTLTNDPLPDMLKPQEAAGVKFLQLSFAKSALVDEINDESEVGLKTPDYRKKLIDIARGAQDGSLSGLFDDQSGKWAEAVKAAGS